MSEEREQYVINQPVVDEGTMSSVTNGSTWAETLVITTQDERKTASAGVAKIKGMIKTCKDLFADSKTAANAAHKAVCEAEGKLVKPLENAAALAGRKLVKFDADQAEIARREQARINAEAEEQARRDRARLEKEAARLKTPERKQERLEMAAAIIPVAATVQSAPARVAGEVHSSTWKAELLSLGELLEAAVTNELALSFVAFDQSAADKLARATKGAVTVPGVRFVESKSISYRSK